MKIYATLSFLLGIAACKSREESGSETQSLKETSSLVNNNDGTFLAVCKDGHTEKRTLEELEAGNVCGEKDSGKILLFASDDKNCSKAPTDLLEPSTNCRSLSTFSSHGSVKVSGVCVVAGRVTRLACEMFKGNGKGDDVKAFLFASNDSNCSGLPTGLVRPSTVCDSLGTFTQHGSIKVNGECRRVSISSSAACKGLK